MCREMEQIYNDGMGIGKNEGILIGKNEGILIGKMEMKQESALSMAKLGLPVEQIAKVVKESVSLVQKWISEGLAQPNE